ncbi:MAG: IclR family transcriptional regulator [Parvularculaceae bacterium]|nr:IclR family transcriptional regulator [Parvularculaceae bacterium]
MVKVPKKTASSKSVKTKDDPGKYRAPALEKGLDVLELLVNEGRALTMNEICQLLGRSQGEMFRMVQVLQSRGFVKQDIEADGYRLTDRLFTMAMRQPVTRGLVEIALPHMRTLANVSGQSCHLALAALGEYFVVVARMESSEQLGFSVRVGFRQSLSVGASGIVLMAFQPQDVRDRWLENIDFSGKARGRDAYLKMCKEARAQGYVQVPSQFVSGVTDISAPLFRGSFAAGALTIPYIDHANAPMGEADVVKALVDHAALISGELIEGDSRT